MRQEHHLIPLILTLRTPLMLAPGTMELMLMRIGSSSDAYIPSSVPESSDSGEESEIFPIQEIDMENLSTATKKKKPKRPCYYCGEEQSQLVRHLTRKHKMEDAVVAALKLPKMEQRRAFEKIRKDGILKMNISQQEKMEEIKAGLKLMIGYGLKKLIKTAKGYYIQTNEMEKSVEVDRFSAVLDLNWDYIFYTAQVMCEQRRNTLRKPQAMPVEEDVSKLRAFILNEMQKLSDDELMKWDHHYFCKDAELDC
ncbi:hypothetical protein RRG08_059689 [Elysia crispata]|uniref:Uncharacterized protein n=1 Tax=Elysia crispata TaxID=231223 RepID=A0AAE1DFH5_9GAST|nr:hypothetical protein RRG08_059689 [Elysia crispata]